MSQCYNRIKVNSKLANMCHHVNRFDLKCKEMNISNMCVNNCVECCKDYFFVSENEFLMILEELIHKKEILVIIIKRPKKY